MKIVSSSRETAGTVGGALHDLNMALQFEGFEPRESFPLRGYKIIALPFPQGFVQRTPDLVSLFIKAADNAGFLAEALDTDKAQATIPVGKDSLTVIYSFSAGAYHFFVS